MEVQKSFFNTNFEKNPFIEGDFFQLQNRRYIGNKYKLKELILYSQRHSV